MAKHSGNRFSFIRSLHIFHTLSKSQGTFWLGKLGHLYSHILKFPKDIGPDHFCFCNRVFWERKHFLSYRVEGSRVSEPDSMQTGTLSSCVIPTKLFKLSFMWKWAWWRYTLHMDILVILVGNAGKAFSIVLVSQLNWCQAWFVM